MEGKSQASQLESMLEGELTRHVSVYMPESMFQEIERDRKLRGFRKTSQAVRWRIFDSFRREQEQE